MLRYVHDTTKIWRLWDPIQKSVINAADVIFDEDNNLEAKGITQSADTSIPSLNTFLFPITLPPPPTHLESETHSNTFVARETLGDHLDDTSTHAGNSVDLSEPYDDNLFGEEEMGEMIVVQPLPTTRSHAMLATTGSDEPTSFKEAIEGPEAEQWRGAIDEEYASLQKYNTWVFTQLPLGCRAIPCKWVFKKKYNSVNNTVQYKACLVVKEYEQQEGIDYTKTFAPVAMLKTVQILLALAAYFDWEVQQIDVVTVFLNLALNEEVYMAHPEGFEEDGKVCLLQKIL